MNYGGIGGLGGLGEDEDELTPEEIERIREGILYRDLKKLKMI